MAVYVISDPHGYYDAFVEGLQMVAFKPSDQLYVIGDAIDRGEDGIKILQYIKRHKNMDLLLGNHELFMLSAVDPDGKKKCGGYDAMLWLFFNGGLKTYESYGKLSIKTRRSILNWLRERYVIKTIEVGGKSFCLTHSYYVEGLENKKFCEMKFSDVWDVVWRSVYREERETHGNDIYSEYDHIFVTGHVPVQRVLMDLKGIYEEENEPEAFVRGNHIDIDGGCAYGYDMGIKNGLIFLRLDDMKTFFVPLKMTE